MRSERRRHQWLLRTALFTAMVVMGCAVGPGCQRKMMDASAVEQFGTADDELDFLDAVNSMSAVTNNDALHALFLLCDGADPSTTYEARVEAAKARRWMPSGFDRPANESASVGWLSMAGCAICDIRGGLTMHVLGPSPRYCTKELVFLKIMPLRSENQSMTGAEFNDYINRIGRVRSGRSLAVVSIPGEQGPAGEQAATPMNEADVEEMLPSPSTGAPTAPKKDQAPTPSTP